MEGGTAGTGASEAPAAAERAPLLDGLDALGLLPAISVSTTSTSTSTQSLPPLPPSNGPPPDIKPPSGIKLEPGTDASAGEAAAAAPWTPTSTLKRMAPPNGAQATRPPQLATARGVDMGTASRAVGSDALSEALLTATLLEPGLSTASGPFQIGPEGTAFDFGAELPGLLETMFHDMGAGAAAAVPPATKIECVLEAPTSPAQRVNQDTLTYLDQARTYRLRLKGPPGVYKTAFSLCLSNGQSVTELEPQYSSWLAANTKRNVLDMDKLASMGIKDVKLMGSKGSAVFSWDGSQGCVASFRVNCLSTEFAPHRRGGEKGAFLRLQLDTVEQVKESDGLSMIDSSTCLIKVFKAGADRRLKADQDKVKKLIKDKSEDKEKDDDGVQYQGSSPQTTLVPSDCGSVLPMRYFQQDTMVNHAMETQDHGGPAPMFAPRKSEPRAPSAAGDALAQRGKHAVGGGRALSSECDDDHRRRAPRPRLALRVTELSSCPDVQQWLKENHFYPYLKTFSHYNGHLLLKLTKPDFIEICGAAEGIRMHATLLHGRDPPAEPNPTLSINTYTQTGM